MESSKTIKYGIYLLYIQVLFTITNIAAESEVKLGEKDLSTTTDTIQSQSMIDALGEEKFDARQFEGEDLDIRIQKVSAKITALEAADYLERFGYETGDRRGLTGKRLELFLSPALKLFQRRMEIPETGELDDRTKREMATPRCAFPDYLTEKSDRSKRYILGNSQWQRSDFPLRVVFTSHSRLMGRDAQERAFMDAADSWAKVSGLNFVRGNFQTANIRIGFTHHDGPWGVLGKAWFPRVGRIEFENGENWIDKISVRGSMSGSLSFYSVAMHELGHALGISHSNVRNAIMHGQYQRDVLHLTADDIRAVTRLYGPAGPPPRPPPPPPKPATTKKPAIKKLPSKNKNKNKSTNKRNKNKGSNKRGTKSRSSIKRLKNKSRSKSKSRSIKSKSPSRSKGRQKSSRSKGSQKTKSSNKSKNKKNNSKSKKKKSSSNKKKGNSKRKGNGRRRRR